MKVSVLKSLVRYGVRLAGLSVFVLGMAAIAQAQAAGATAQPAMNAAAPAAAPANSAQAAQPTAAGERKPRGNHEGITVHGHWTIEVRNPDGKLVSHTEFENALVQPDGAISLSSLLLGGAVVGGYRIDLGSDTTDLNGPCAAINSGRSTTCFLIGSLISPEPAAFGDQSSACGGTGYANQITPTGPCFPLGIAPVSNTGVAFSGTAVANTTVSITDVFLNPTICYSNSFLTPGTSTISPNSCAQGLPGETVKYGLTHATLPAPVTISAAGQLISVNVQLSFQ